MAVAVAVAVAVSGAVAVAGLTKRFFNHIQKDFLINVWVYSANLENGNCNVTFQITLPTLVGDEAASAPTKIRRLHLFLVFVSFRFVTFRFVSFRSVSFRFVSFRFVSFRFVSFRFVSFRFVSFRFVSNVDVDGMAEPSVNLGFESLLRI